MSDTLNDLGKILTGPYGRDAVHIAVCPVVAVQTLKPGQHVGLVAVDGAAAGGPIYVGVSRKPVGIVDPYLKVDVKPEQQFYLFLYPQTITSLRHLWTHPSFPDASPATEPSGDVANSREWLQNFAIERDTSYESLLRGVGSYITFGTSDYDMDPDVSEEFWFHVETVLGRRVPHSERQKTIFSCSC